MKVMVIDGNSILNRSFYGVRLLTNHEGMYTNAIYGFLSTLLKLQEEETPERIIVCFDVKGKTFRHEKFDGYKATRKGMPDELAMQLPIMKEILGLMGIVCCEKQGYEADDLIGTISRVLSENSDECIIVTGDRDSLQLISEKTSVKLITGKSVSTVYTPEVFETEYGFEPKKLVDLKALMGDSSDNISGVAGIGAKTADSLIKQFGSLDGIYQNIDDSFIKKGVREKLITGEQQAKDSYWLATIDRFAPLPIDPTNLDEQQLDKKPLFELLNKLELKSFIKRLSLDDDKPKSDDKKLDISVKYSLDYDEIMQAVNSLKENENVYIYAKNEREMCILQHNNAFVLAGINLSDECIAEIMKALFSGKVQIVMHDAKEVLVNILKLGVNPNGICFDTAIAAYMLNPAEGQYDIQRLALSYAETEINDIKGEFTPLGDNTELANKFAQYAAVIKEIYTVMSQKLDEQPAIKKLYEELELPLMTVLAEMQEIGCKVDDKLLYEFGEMLDSRITELESKIYDNAGGEFNINSTKQLGEILFERLGLPVQKKTKTGYSTSAEVLEAIAGYHPIVGDVLEYRQLTKLKSTYVDGLLKVIDKKDGRIHSHFQQTVTATGRLSSVEPNLQNIPVRTELGRELRKMFVAENDEYVLIDADYSQIELRVLAHVAQDEAMLDAFRHGADIHAATASKVYNVPIDEVTSQMRSSCKAVNFGIVYGISDFALAGDLGISRKKAAEFINNYLATYTGVKRYMDESKAFGKEHGYVETLAGRRRYLPELSSKSFAIRSFGERVAMNTPIQGTAADIIKIAMLRVRNRLKNEGLRSRLILQVHDELILEAHIDEKEKALNILTEEMQGAMQLDVPLVAEAHVGKDWYTAKG